MSDEFDEDDFLLDESFLKQVDDIEAKASAKPTVRVSAKAAGGPIALGWSGPQRNVASTSSGTKPMELQTNQPARSGASTGVAGRIASTSAVPRAAVDHRSSVIPSSRLGRTSSGNGDNFLQIHLNFRKERPATKGKRWDRTAFAESGRRVDAERAKKKGKFKARTWARDDDEEEPEDLEDEDEEPLVPPPKPFVDSSAPYEPQRHLPNAANIDTYLYPTNKPKREYQYDIIRTCFADNCLVALPTGLGKTFIAGVVMLNFYRWFPTGKIVFLAPTKPLVNQQIEACQMTCGIPSGDAAVMTGQSVSAKERARMWAERRVFYCTPQTLDNDLKNGSVDPRDIVLAVFDEAHKASGSYAYTTILAYITAHHPFFRVLALTATPGADVPRVQAVVDALHISRIEIREAEAPEIRRYMNEKRTQKHLVQMGPVIEEFRDRWAKLMKPYVQKLVDKDILSERDLDIKRLRPFRLTARRMEIARNRDSSLKWSLGSLLALDKMARAMGHLLEFSIGMFHTILMEIAGNSTANGKKATAKSSSNSMRNNFEFQKLVRDVEAEMNCIRIGQRGKTKADRHPKMAKTLELLLQHFTEAEDDETIHGVKNDTRAMVFCSYRECVMEIVDMLNDHAGIVKATKFVGQSQGKQEADKGFNQKEQKKTIADFKEGKFNVLVSTSIGEEGLDIGEVDFVVIYDMPKQSIKLLQRIGRTGRKRDGKVHVLMSEGREDANWDTAQQTHREIQEEILHSRNLELFEDVERLLPGDKMPTCVEQEMPVDPWDPEDQKSKKRLVGATKAEGPKQKKQRGHEIPEGGHEGFKSVADLLRSAGKRKVNGSPKGKGRARTGKRSLPSDADESEEEEEEPEEEAEESDQDLEALCDSMMGSRHQKDQPAKAPRRADRESTNAVKPARRTTTKATSTKTKVTVDNNSVTVKTKSARKVDDPEEQEAIEQLSRSALDFFNAEGPSRRREPTPPLLTPPSSPLGPAKRDRELRPPFSPHTGGSDGSPSPTKPPKIDSHDLSTRPGNRLSPRTAAAAGFSQVAAIDLTWGDDETFTTPAKPMVPIPPSSSPLPAPPQSSRQSETLVPSGRRRIMGLSRPRATQTKSAIMMPPPPKPSALPPSSPDKIPPSFGVAEETQPIRRVKTGRRAMPVILSSAEKPSPVARRNGPGLTPSSGPESPFLPPNRLRRRHVDTSSSPDMTTRRHRPPPDSSSIDRVPTKRIRRANPEHVNELLDLDVGVSGSESADEPSDDEESESDRLFAGKDFAPTQAPKGYNQRAVYAAGLSTQAGSKAGLAFKSNHEKGEAFMAKARKPVLVTDDEASEGSENEYELGSFVCPDEDVLFDTQSDPLSGSRP